MSVQPDRFELAQQALRSVYRIVGRLRNHEQDLAQKTPGVAQDGEALRDAASAAERVAQSLEASVATAAPTHPNL